MENQDSFEIGLCLAGAVSAGAYTAGVIDYLIEALEDWQQRKESGEDNIPSHDVKISVIGGASAGGMTGIITSAAVYDEIIPVQESATNILDQITYNKFYHSWVDLVSDDMLTVLLDNNDITTGGLMSVLNSGFIDQIADKAINVAGNHRSAKKYFSENLKIFTTLSNLEGMDFSVGFNSNAFDENKYIITSHNDYACFMLVESEEDYLNDGWIPLNFLKKLNSSIAKDAAMATGAFPVGLKAREVTRDSKFLNDLSWFKYITKDSGNPFELPDYKTINIDGGMINNEPFDYVRNVLLDNTKQNVQNDYQNYNRFKSTILMIDPFPSQASEFKGTTQLMSVVNNTLRSMVDQSRIKSPSLIDSMDSNMAGQFLITPVRYTPEAIDGSFAIACGALDGFSGFLHKEFRIHDYFLGRANCEKFLRDHFTVPNSNSNEIFNKGYEKVADQSPYISQKDQGFQIIPIFSPRKPDLYMPTFSNGKKWPSVSEHYIDGYRNKIKKRVNKILMYYSNHSFLQRQLLSIAYKLVLNGKFADFALHTIKDSLQKHQLLR